MILNRNFSVSKVDTSQHLLVKTGLKAGECNCAQPDATAATAATTDATAATTPPVATTPATQANGCP